MRHAEETMDYTPPILAILYTGFVTFFTGLDQANIEFLGKMFMYASAGILSLVTVYYMIKNKGKHNGR